MFSVLKMYYSEFARNTIWGGIIFFGMGSTKKQKMACIQGHIYFLNFIGVTYCSKLIYSNDIQEINMSLNTCHFQFLCDAHAKYRPK